MLEWIRIIGEFIVGLIEGAANLFPLFVDSIGVIGSAIATAPPFLYYIMSLMLSVCIVMWVVNIF